MTAKDQKIDQLITELLKTNDGSIVSELNAMGVQLTFLDKGIRWTKTA